MRRDLLVQTLDVMLTYGRIVHEVFCFASDTVFLFGKTFKKFWSFKLEKVLAFDWGFVLVENSNFCVMFGKLFFYSSSKSLDFEFCSPGYNNINTWNTLGHGYLMHERILYCFTLFSRSLCLLVFPLHMVCS